MKQLKQTSLRVLTASVMIMPSEHVYIRSISLLVQVGNTVALDDPTKASFAATFLSCTAAAWWYTLVPRNAIPTTWDEFENALTKELLPFDSVQRSRDKLRRLLQGTSVLAYLSEFRNVALTIPGIKE